MSWILDFDRSSLEHMLCCFQKDKKPIMLTGDKEPRWNLFYCVVNGRWLERIGGNVLWDKSRESNNLLWKDFLSVTSRNHKKNVCCNTGKEKLVETNFEHWLDNSCLKNVNSLRKHYRILSSFYSIHTFSWKFGVYVAQFWLSFLSFFFLLNSEFISLLQ